MARTAYERELEAAHLSFGFTASSAGVIKGPAWFGRISDPAFERLWPTPEGVPFHTLPRAQVLDRLRALTNLRVVPAEGAPTGYRLEAEAFPGWESVPTW